MVSQCRATDYYSLYYIIMNESYYFFIIYYFKFITRYHNTKRTYSSLGPLARAHVITKKHRQHIK